MYKIQTKDFNLDDMNIGDYFLACNNCGFQLAKNSACYPICHCGNRMNKHKVTEKDMEEYELSKTT